MAAYAKMTDTNRIWGDLIEEVRRAYPIDQALEDYTGQAIRWRRTGSGLVACCPFHVDKNPSFSVNVSKGVYHCFTDGCGAGGDIFDLVQETLDLGFNDAVIEAAGRCGVAIPEEIAKRRGDLPHVRKRPPAPRRSRMSGISEVSQDLKPYDLTPVHPSARRPRAGEKFSIWQDGGRDKDREFKVLTYTPEMVHEYRDIARQLIMIVLRVPDRKRGKFFVPARLMEPVGSCPEALIEKDSPDGVRLSWINQGPGSDSFLPVYGMEDAQSWGDRGGSNILIVEGEKTRDAAKRLVTGFDPDGDWLVLSPMGGGSSCKRAYWGPLLEVSAGRRVNISIWQDADSPLERPDGSREDRQRKHVGNLMTGFWQAAIDAGMEIDDLPASFVIPPEGVKSGWDLADAEAEGWKPEDVSRYLREEMREVEKSMASIRQPIAKMIDDGIETSPDAPDPGPEAQPQGGNAFDAEWADVLGLNDAADPAALSDIPAEPVTEDDTILPDEIGMVEPADDGSDEPIIDPLLFNPYFKCLGYLDGNDYFMSLTSKQIFSLSPKAFTQQNLLHLAPLEFWKGFYKKDGYKGPGDGIDWTAAYDSLIQGCYQAGVWDPRREVRQGARIDGGTVIFHTGQKLHVQNRGTTELHDFEGRNCYTVGPQARTPDFENPFQADSPEIREYLQILSKLDWREETRELSIMATFGWVMISTICGILKWRPHLWLDGPRSSGKTWVVNNLVLPALGDYAERVVSNSSESGIRNLLNFRSMPIVFDEAEGEDRENRQRMDAILRLARHSAAESNSVVAHGVAGGGSHRHYSIASSFLMSSIMPQLEAAADKTRFGRARLASGRNYEDFSEGIEGPALDLLNDQFADRLVARMVCRAGDYHDTYQLMVQALCRMGLERRVADVYGTFATGSWLALCEGVPENVAEAIGFVMNTFNVQEQLQDFGEDLKYDKDHHRIFREIASSEIRIDSRNAGAQSVTVGALMEIACGSYPDDDVLLSADEALSRLREIGLRPGVGQAACKPGETPTTMLIHKNSSSIAQFLEKTPYARSYEDVIHQAEGVRTGGPVRFGAGMGPSRTLVVPLTYFSIGED